MIEICDGSKEVANQLADDGACCRCTSADRFLLLQKVQRVFPSTTHTEKLYRSVWLHSLPSALLTVQDEST